MAGMLQILTYMIGFYFVIKGLEFFLIAAASPRPNRSGLFIYAGICLAVFVVAAIAFATFQDNQAMSMQRSTPSL
jgi:hypothetical protein